MSAHGRPQERRPPRRRLAAGSRARGLVPGELELSRATQKAVALAQQEKSTWTRADLIKYLGRVLPRSGLDPSATAVLLEDLADRALRSEFEPVLCLEAPEPAEVPSSLLRADGRSVYRRHGGTRYATCAQLSMEDRMAAQAGAGGAPLLAAEHLVNVGLVLLAITLALWYRTEGTIAVNMVSTPRVEAFYWAAITFSQTLGTALGDWMAAGPSDPAATTGSLGLGYLGSAAIDVIFVPRA